MILPNKQELRRLWFTVHKWLGLCLALPVVLIFLSGSLLVWKASVDDLLHPQRRVSVAATRAPAFYLAAAHRALLPDEHVASLTFPEGNGAVMVTAVTSDGRSVRSRSRYFLDPLTGNVLDRSLGDGRLAGRMHVLHGSLFLGWAGGRLVGLIAIVLLISAFSGLWLWWPMRGPVVHAMRWGRTQSTNANIHHQTGYWFALPLAALAVTGATITFQSYFNALLGDAAGVRAENARASAPPLAPPHLQLSQVLAADGSPADVVSVTWPTSVDGHWLVSSRSKPDIVVDDATGRAALQGGGRPETTSRLMRRIHDGTEMPFAWQVVIFMTGIIGALMAITGVIMWLKGQVREVRMRGRRRARAAD